MGLAHYKLTNKGGNPATLSLLARFQNANKVMQPGGTEHLTVQMIYKDSVFTGNTLGVL